MDNFYSFLICGIEKINFQQHPEQLAMDSQQSKKSAAESLDVCPENKNELESQFGSSNESIETNEEAVDASCSSSALDDDRAQCSQRRMPSRSCKDSLRMNRRSIMKPTKRVSASKSCDFSSLRPVDIKNIYLKNKLTNFRPTSLETIFEEPQVDKRATVGRVEGADSQVRFIGAKKIRRCLSCSDGLNINKALTKQRRARIKRIFGRRTVLKKISLTDFLEQLNKNIDDEDAIPLEASSSSGQMCDTASMSTTSTCEVMDDEATKVESATESEVVSLPMRPMVMSTELMSCAKQ